MSERPQIEVRIAVQGDDHFVKISAEGHPTRYAGPYPGPAAAYSAMHEIMGRLQGGLEALSAEVTGGTIHWARVTMAQ